jgi:hypothetical protein
MTDSLGVVLGQNDLIALSIADHFNSTDGDQIPKIKARVSTLVVDQTLLTVLRIDTCLSVAIKPLQKKISTVVLKGFERELEKQQYTAPKATPKFSQRYKYL